MFKLLTIRTLHEVLLGRAAYWRLSDPSSLALGLRGSMLIEVSDLYLSRRWDAVCHWCPLDSGGLRNGFEPGPPSLTPDDLLMTRDSLRIIAEILERDVCLRRLVRLGRPLPFRVMEEAMPVAVAHDLTAAVSSREWTYEVHLHESLPVAADEVLSLWVPNAAFGEVSAALAGRGIPCRLIECYNPRWTLDGARRGSDPLRGWLRAPMRYLFPVARGTDTHRAR